MRKPVSTIVAAFTLCSTVSAQAAPSAPCITPPEMTGLIAYFLPDVIGEVSRNCSVHLSPDSYVRGPLTQMGTSLAQHKGEHWPTAKAAFLKMGTAKEAKEMASLPDEALRPLVDAAMASRMSIPVNAATCADVNDIAQALAPLSSEQTVDLLATIFNIAARKDNKLRSCPRETK